MSGVARRWDCIVVGAGHNGLVCAAYLARAGRQVLVLEAADTVGGAAVTCEFAPGYRVSACAHLLAQLPESLVQELALERHGLRFAGGALRTTALDAGGAHLDFGAGGVAGLASRSAADARVWPEFDARLRRLARALQPILETVPPRLGTESWEDRRTLLGMGLRLRRLGRRDLRELLRIGGMCVQDLLDEQFETPLLKGAVGLDAVLGSNLAPRSPGSVLTLLTRAAAASVSHGTRVPLGGVGALCEALAAAARASGAALRTSAPVQCIRVRQDRACGVVLASGEELEAGLVISGADPKTTFLSLVGAQHLDAGFVRRIGHLRTRGLAAKLHLALDAAPAFRGMDPRALGERLLIAPSLEHIERAFNHSKYGELPAAPVLEVLVPSARDPGLAPAGRHVLSATVQYVPHTPAGGWSSAQREQLLKLVLASLEAHAPGICAAVVASELLTPADIEARFRIHGGHWHHAELAFDQFFMVRPVPGAAQYRTPLPGLYLCGAGCHPGGGVMGTAGRNAARQILREVA